MVRRPSTQRTSAAWRRMSSAGLSGTVSGTVGSSSGEPRIKDVARHAGVSTATVSRVLNGYPHVRADVRRRVLGAIEALSYRPNYVARNMRVQTTTIIGWLARNARNPNFAAAYSGAHERAEEAGYALLVCNSQGDSVSEATYLQLLQRHRVDGLVVYVADERVDNLGPVVDARIPLVLVESGLAEYAVDRVNSDGEHGVFVATQHLLELGHRDVGIVLGRPEILPSQERHRGFLRALANASLTPGAGRVQWCDESAADAGRAVAALLDGPGGAPTAVVAATYQVTTACLQLLHGRSLRIPRDISVVGFDDTEVAQLAEPGLTVVRRDLGRLGSVPLEMLLARIHGAGGPPRTELLPCDLVVRGSTARL
jgi:LacI family transcriptional regulator